MNKELTQEFIVKNRKKSWNTKDHATFAKQVKSKQPHLVLLGEYTTNKSKIKAKCLTDGYIWDVLPSKLLLDRHVCPCCCNQAIVIGLNDMWTTQPNLAKLLLNPNDGYTHTAASNKKLDWLCPDCENAIKSLPDNIARRGIKCAHCNDGKSYPEKFCNSVLSQLCLDYEWSYSPQWLIDETGSQRKFDFYIPNYNLVIETDGKLGHGKKVFNHKSPTLEEALAIDAWKDKQARDNGLTVVRIEADESTLEYLKQNITNALENMFDLSKVDWLKCDRVALTSKVKEVANIFNANKNITTTEIAALTRISRGTILRYLKRATAHGWCNYSAEEARRYRYQKIAMQNKSRNV